MRGRPKKDLAAQLRDFGWGGGQHTLAGTRNAQLLHEWCEFYLGALGYGADHPKLDADKAMERRFGLGIRQVQNIVHQGMRLHDLLQAESERQRMQAQVLERAQQLSASYLPADAALAPELQLAFALLGEHGARLKAEKSAAELQSQLGAKRTRDTANAAVPAYRRPAETKQPPKR